MRPLISAALLVVLFSLSPVARAEDQISQDRAVHLADMAVKKEDRNPILDPFDGKDVHFFFFEEINPNPNVSAHIRSLAVNKLTGDVWSIDGICRHRWPALSDKKVRRLKPPRSDTPWQCDKDEEADK
jgi:hypothetical protein